MGNKRWMSMMLAMSMTATMMTGCATKNKTTAPAAVSDDGKVLNIYCFNEEFKTRIEENYGKYKAVNATTGKIGDVTVKWNITPTTDNAFQNNLDENLRKQKDANADDKIDMVILEADAALKYIDTDYIASVSDLGIQDADLVNQYQYTKDLVTDSDGKLKGVTWQGCPGALFYNRDVAKEVFGTDDPEKVQEYVKDWDSFKKTAETLKQKGYSITSSANDTYRVYSNNVSSKWVEDGKINIDDNIMRWVDDSKQLVDDGCTAVNDMFSDDWKKGFYPEGKVFCYLGPAWLVNFCMAADTKGSVGYEGKWAATEGPQGFFWGGSWICGTSDTDNASIVKDIMLELTTNEEVMTNIVKKYDDFVNNQEVMDKMAADQDYSSKIMGGQNPLGIFCKGVENLNMSNLSSYDATCNEEFQNAMKNYFLGNATKEEALDQFKKAVVEKHPELSY